LKDETFIGFKKHLSMYRLIEKYFLKEGFIPHTSFEGEDIPTIISFVSSGLGIAILPQYDEAPHDSVKRIRLSSCTIKRQIGLAFGAITGLDGSGFSGISLAGSVGSLFGNAIGGGTATLTALGQITAI